MAKFLVWADDRKAEAVIISAADMTDAIESAAARFSVEECEVNILSEDRFGEADYYGVADAEEISE